MRSHLWNFVARLQRLIKQQDGQDLVEYALAVSLIAFAAVAGVKSLAAGVRTAYTNISTQLSSNIT